MAIFKKIKDKEFFARGKRGEIYVGEYRGKKVAIKIKRPGSKAIGRIENEARVLKELNKNHIGPKFIAYEEGRLIYEFIEGIFIKDLIEKANKTRIRMVLLNVLKQCRVLDKVGIIKEEMHKPLKHIIVGKRVVLIDFERGHISNKPKNVTQFCQFIIKVYKDKKFKLDVVELRKILANYKKDQKEKNFRAIVKLL